MWGEGRERKVSGVGEGEEGGQEHEGVTEEHGAGHEAAALPECESAWLRLGGLACARRQRPRA